MTKNEKNNEIIKIPSFRSLGLRATKERRKEMVIKVFFFKIQKNKLSKDKKIYLDLVINPDPNTICKK